MCTAHASVTQTHRVLSLGDSVILPASGRDADAFCLTAYVRGLPEAMLHPRTWKSAFLVQCFLHGVPPLRET